MTGRGPSGDWPAHLFDPYVAINTADIDPLPHQIEAVYQRMLPQQPLRFLLADDPGAGKTIMSGLYIRELAGFPSTYPCRSSTWRNLRDSDSPNGRSSY